MYWCSLKVCETAILGYLGSVVESLWDQITEWWAHRHPGVEKNQASKLLGVCGWRLFSTLCLWQAHSLKSKCIEKHNTLMCSLMWKPCRFLLPFAQWSHFVLSQLAYGRTRCCAVAHKKTELRGCTDLWLRWKQLERKPGSCHFSGVFQLDHLKDRDVRVDFIVMWVNA